MKNDQRTNERLTQIIIQILENKKPENVQQLVNLVKENVAVPESKIVEHIVWLQSHGKILLKKKLTQVPKGLSAFLKTREAYWYWTTVVLAVMTTVAVFMIPEEAYPMVYVRYLFGAIFVLWLPGHSLLRALFPTKSSHFKTSGKSLDSIERVALSIGMSLAVVPMVGLLLNYTPWGIHLTSMVSSLFVLTLVFSTTGVMREHQSRLKENP